MFNALLCIVPPFSHLNKKILIKTIETEKCWNSLPGDYVTPSSLNCWTCGKKRWHIVLQLLLKVKISKQVLSGRAWIRFRATWPLLSPASLENTAFSHTQSNADLSITVKLLMTRSKDAENRLHHNNVSVLGLPEGAEGSHHIIVAESIFRQLLDLQQVSPSPWTWFPLAPVNLKFVWDVYILFHFFHEGAGHWLTGIHTKCIHFIAQKLLCSACQAFSDYEGKYVAIETNSQLLALLYVYSPTPPLS